jgi:hypothetical protein
MDQIPLYPLRFEPIYQYRLWGSWRLANLLTTPLPGDGPNRILLPSRLMTIPLSFDTGNSRPLFSE